MQIGLVSEIGMRGKSSSHPTDKQLTVVTNGADHFICETPNGHESLEMKPVLRKATEEESNHHRGVWGALSNYC